MENRQQEKLKTYLGFGIRARKLVLGTGAIKATRGTVYLLIADRNASTNTKKEIEGLKRKFSCPIVEVDDLEGLTGKAFCKLAAMRDANLAQAVMKTLQTDETDV